MSRFKKFLQLFATTTSSNNKYLSYTGLRSLVSKINTKFSTKSKKIELTLAASSWTGSSPPYTASISSPYITGSEKELIEVFINDLSTFEQKESWASAGIISGKNELGKVIITAIYDKPTVDLPVILLKHGDLG